MHCLCPLVLFRAAGCWVSLSQHALKEESGEHLGLNYVKLEAESRSIYYNRTGFIIYAGNVAFAR